ncbi:hypothetical protein [Micromonospora profundi]|uniref:hypothetical protein n=1 Tax=Micromonospora profundi TaxID=1420889 RepID=UPI0036BFB143
MPSRVYFSDYFGVNEDDLDSYGALNICLVSDLPLFVDPFLLFQSEKEEYHDLHDSIIKYLGFLKDHSALARQDKGLLKEWFFFGEVKENWLGFTFLGNGGRGLGEKFALSLSSHLSTILDSERDSVHLEHVRLLDKGVGRDSVSDLTTNLIKKYILEYTQEFALRHIHESKRRKCGVGRVEFDYETRAWRSRTYDLPFFGPRNQHVLLTPLDILARDETWINRDDLLRNFDRVVESCDDETLRGRMNHYFSKKLMEARSAEPRTEAIEATLRRFPELYALYMATKEREGDAAERRSRDSVEYVQAVFVSQIRRIIAELESRTDFYGHVPDSYEEALKRVQAFKNYVENQDGYRVINRKGKPFSDEMEVQLFFGLIWYGTTFDVNREPNNGRGPVDFKVSYGRGDKALVELKLASNTSLEQNLRNQVRIYEKANQTDKSIKVIIFYNEQQERKLMKVLKKLDLENQENVVIVDARSDNKPSASTA